MSTANTIPEYMTPAELVENIADAERLLGKARVCFGPNARAVRELTAEIATLKAEAARRGLKVQAEDLKTVPDHTLLKRHQDALKRETNLREAGNTQGADDAKREADSIMREQKRRGKERGSTL